MVCISVIWLGYVSVYSAGEEVHIQESNSSGGPTSGFGLDTFLPLAACVQTGVSRSGLVGRSRGQVASRAVESGQCVYSSQNEPVGHAAINSVN